MVWFMWRFCCRWNSAWSQIIGFAALFFLQLTDYGSVDSPTILHLREYYKWWNCRLMIEQSCYKIELCGRKRAGIGGLPMLAWSQSVSTGDAKWSQAVPSERWIKATGRGTPRSLITEGRLCRGTWENPAVGKDFWFALWAELRLARTANLCGAFSFRSKGPTPLPSMQAHWNICSRIRDISLEDFPSGHIKTNSFMLPATPMTTGVLTTQCPHLCCSFQEKITKDGLFNREKMSIKILSVRCLLSWLHLIYVGPWGTFTAKAVHFQFFSFDVSNMHTYPTAILFTYFRKNRFKHWIWDFMF